MGRHILLMSVCSVLLFLQPIAPAKAQNSKLENLYNTETIYLKPSIGRYVKNGETHSVGIFNRKLDKEFNKVSNLTKGTWKEYRRMSRNGTLQLIGGVALFISGVWVSVANPELGLTLLLVGLGIEVSGFSNILRGEDLLHQAIWMRNRDVTTTF